MEPIVQEWTCSGCKRGVITRSRAAPDGTILGTRLVKPSGNAEWDQAVLRALDKTQTLPRDDNGRIPSSFVITFRPRD